MAVGAVLKRPGVYVNESINRSNVSTGQTGTAAPAIIGAASRGPQTPTPCNSWADFVRNFGGFGYSTYLANAVYSYFSNAGGGPIYVTRVANPTGAVAAVTSMVAPAGLPDGETPSPVDQLKVTAANPGGWGNSIYLDVANYTISGAIVFDLTVHFGSATGTVVERYTQLSMDPTQPRYAPNYVNRLSSYIVLQDVSATPAANHAPTTVLGVALAGGSDGTGNPGSGDYLNAVTALTAAVQQPLLINLAGVSDSASINAVTGYLGGSTSTQYAFLVVDLPYSQSASGDGSATSGFTPSTYAACYAPWINVNDPASPTPGIRKSIPPGGAVLGQIVSADALVGPWQAPAGVITRLTDAVSVVTAYTDSDLDALATLGISSPAQQAVPVNPIVQVPSVGLCIMGDRTFQQGYPQQYISVRRSLIYLERTIRNLMQQFLFYPNDQNLWNVLSNRIGALLNTYYQQGGLAGSNAAQAFYVRCDSTVNDANAIANGVCNVEVGIALAFPAEYIVLNLGQYQGSTTA